MNQQWPSVARIDRNLPQTQWLMSPGMDRGASETPDTTAEVGDLWRILARRYRTILLVTALVTAGSLLYAFLAPSLYTATSQILIDPRDRQVVSNDLNSSALSPDGGIAQVESQVRVIESDSVLLRAIAEVGLETDPEFGGPSTGLLSRLVQSFTGSADESPEAAKAKALRSLRRKLAVKRADKVFVIDVIVTASDPDKTARIVNAIAKGYLADQADARADAARRAAGELSARLDALRADVNKAETRLEAFKAKNGLIASSGRIVNEQQITDSNARLVAARNRTTDAKSRLQAVRDARGRAFDPGAAPEAISSAVIERLRSQYADLTSREADLRTQLGARHPFIQAVRTQKADVKRLIDAELDRIVQAAEIEYQRALTNERMLTGNLDALRAESVQTGKASVQLRELEREVEAARSVYNAFLVRSREVGEQAGVDPTNARVITWARPPEERSWPLRLLVIGAGLAGGLGCGAGLALVREYVNPTLLSRRQLERLLGAPVLAVLPGARHLAKGSGAAPAAFALDGLYGLNSSPGGQRALTVMVTAAASDASERKAAIDLLAAVATARGDRVLVIEADLSAGQVGEGGLLEVLRGEQSLNAVSAEDTATGARRLGVGNGQKPVRDAFERENVSRFLAGIGSRYDLVLFDGGTLSENLRIGALAASVDRLLVVARGGLTRQKDLIDLGKVAATLQRPIAGTLMIEGGKAGR